jgi:hypothetical protein
LRIRRRRRSTGHAPAQVGQLPFERGDAYVALADRQGDMVQCLVGGLHMVTPQCRGGSEQSHIRGGQRTELGRRVIIRELRHLTTPADRDEHDGDQDRDDGDGHQHEHVMYRVMLSTWS